MMRHLQEVAKGGQRGRWQQANASVPMGHGAEHPILYLQRTIGNQAVRRLLQSERLQAKLPISQPGDRYEQEAHRVADQVMRMPEPTVQRTSAPCAAGGPPCPKCEDYQEPTVQRKVESPLATAEQGVPDNFVRDLGHGQPLDSATRAFFEPRFGHDFSPVRVHTDDRAADSASDVNALAYTVGRDVVFSTGQYAPHNETGRLLLAHELTHVVQQGGANVNRVGQRNENRGQSSSSPSKDNRAIEFRANGRAVLAFGPRGDVLNDVPYFGPREHVQRRVGTGTGMGCVTGPLRVMTSGALDGGYTVNDYLVGGLAWGAVGSPGTTGADGHGFKAQLCASYSGETSLGVSQTMTHGRSNQAFLDGTAAYLGLATGSVTNGITFNEPVLNRGNPYAHTGWELQYGAKTGNGSASLVSFADVPRTGPGEQGYIDFRTCFHSRGGPCQESETCRTWRWTVDFTGSNTTNTVT